MTKSSYSVSFGLKQTLLQTTLVAYNDPVDSQDVVIRFHCAKNLPKRLVGHTDPYFVAKIDNQTTYTSGIISNSSSPVWNDEKWAVRNIPVNAKLSVRVYSKDDDNIVDNYIGRFDISNLLNPAAPTDGYKIIGPFGQLHGHFHLSIRSMPSTDGTKRLPSYTFDGPCRYFRHDSLTVGRLTMLNDDCIYSTWKIHMRRISVYFDPRNRQYWNKDYRAAQAIFGNYPLKLASQGGIKLAHRALHSQTLKNNENGRLTNAQDLWSLIFADRITKKIRPCLYTYIIDDHTWRFSQTGAQFFTDFASKHALLANCSEHVRYAGEFHPRPRHGWDHADADDEWELVFDNGSGTYAPDPALLSNLRELLQFNFPGLHVATYDFKDPQLKESVEQLRLRMEHQANPPTKSNGLFC